MELIYYASIIFQFILSSIVNNSNDSLLIYYEADRDALLFSDLLTKSIGHLVIFIMHFSSIHLFFLYFFTLN